MSDHNVQINCISPGDTYTHMTDQILAAGDRAGWRESEHAEQTRLTGGTPLDKQMDLAMFLASEESNHITGRLVGVMDEWKKLRSRAPSKPGPFSLLRRVQRARKIPASRGNWNPA